MGARVAGIGVRRLGRRAAQPHPVRAPAETCWQGTLIVPVEVLAPDHRSAVLLLGEAGSQFHAELVAGAESAMVVRLRPAAASPGWVFELLALVERWLEACRLPVAKVRHGERTYVITATGHDRRAGVPDPLPAA